ncbi:MAG TPA: hypothetical protein EYO83_06770 [Gemmatimonadetes bacterium]|nr:hypothetical protein [Gemmatimonadota bacterium]
MEQSRDFDPVGRRVRTDHDLDTITGTDADGIQVGPQHRESPLMGRRNSEDRSIFTALSD